MKINSIPPNEMLYQYIHVQEKRKATLASQLSPDTVEITGDAKAFSAALKKAKEQMDASSINQTRVEEIKAQIENGTYHIPGIVVAGKMLGE